MLSLFSFVTGARCSLYDPVMILSANRDPNSCPITLVRESACIFIFRTRQNPPRTASEVSAARAHHSNAVKQLHLSSVLLLLATGTGVRRNMYLEASNMRLLFDRAHFITRIAHRIFGCLVPGAPKKNFFFRPFDFLNICTFRSIFIEVFNMAMPSFCCFVPWMLINGIFKDDSTQIS